MAIPLDLLIDFKGNEFEFSNAVSALSLEIYKKNKKTQEEDVWGEETYTKFPQKLTSQSFEQVLTGKVGYRLPREEN